MRFLSSIIYSLLFAVMFGAFASFGLEQYGVTVSFGTCFTTIMGISVLMSFAPANRGVAFDTVFREIWIDEVKEYVTNLLKDSFLEGIPDYSQHVADVGDENQVIHLSAMQVLPDVLINNTTYPIPVQDMDFTDIPIQLDKYNTKATPITDDELYAMSPKKMDSVKTRHGKAIMIQQVKKAIHALAPSGNTANMPVLLTTGDDDGTGRKRLIKADILTLKNTLDNLEIPDEGRRLVLCKDHLNDLLAIDEKFKDQYYNSQTGKVYNLLGFELYDYAGNPYYTVATKVKKSYGAVPGVGDRKASVFFLVEMQSKAKGWTKMYNSEAKSDPQNQRNLINFRNYWIVMPTAEKYRAAIISDDAA